MFKLNRMKFRVLVFLVFFFLKANAQTPTAMVNNKGNVSKALAAKNPWLGGEVGYKFGGSGEFADNLIASARVMYEIEFDSKKFALPVMGNLSQLRDNLSENLTIDEKESARIQDILTSTQGLNIGLYPYRMIVEKQYFSLLAHGAIVYKLNSFKDMQENPMYFQQGRFSLGIEAYIGKFDTNNGKYPLTISVAPVATFFNSNDYKAIFGIERSLLISLEVTSVVPIGKGVGFLLEGVFSDKSVVRTGLLFSAQLNNK